MPKASARWATRAPTRPRPTTPRVLPCSSTPSHLDRSHLPATSAAWAWGMFRAWASSRAMACSAADRMFDWGALTTITPRSVAAATSTLSRPMPARPTTTRSVPAASTSAVTVVAERITRALAPTMASTSSSGDRPSCTSTSWPAAAMRSRPGWASFSVTRTLPMVFLSIGDRCDCRSSAVRGQVAPECVHPVASGPHPVRRCRRHQHDRPGTRSANRARSAGSANSSARRVTPSTRSSSPRA